MMIIKKSKVGIVCIVWKLIYCSNQRGILHCHWYKNEMVFLVEFWIDSELLRCTYLVRTNYWKYIYDYFFKGHTVTALRTLFIIIFKSSQKCTQMQWAILATLSYFTLKQPINIPDTKVHFWTIYLGSWNTVTWKIHLTTKFTQMGRINCGSYEEIL